jgi:hypothetical protein
MSSYIGRRKFLAALGGAAAACGARATAGDAGGSGFFVVHRLPMQATLLLASARG